MSEDVVSSTKRDNIKPSAWSIARVMIFDPALTSTISHSAFTRRRWGQFPITDSIANGTLSLILLSLPAALVITPLSESSLFRFASSLPGCFAFFRASVTRMSPVNNFSPSFRFKISLPVFFATSLAARIQTVFLRLISVKLGLVFRLFASCTCFHRGSIAYRANSVKFSTGVYWHDSFWGNDV